jgi:hypothetical protein
MDRCPPTHVGGKQTFAPSGALKAPSVRCPLAPGVPFGSLSRSTVSDPEAQTRRELAEVREGQGNRFHWAPDGPLSKMLVAHFSIGPFFDPPFFNPSRESTGLGGIAMRNLAIAAIILGFVLPADGARADEAANPAGMWQWSFPGRGTWPDTAVSLARDGNQVTGFVISNTGSESPISQANYQDGTISFQVRGRFSTFTYTGKLSGDAIEGQIRLVGTSLTQTRPWKAVRVDSRNPSGTWENSVSTNGNTWVTLLRLKREGDKLTGTITPSNARARTIEEGTFKDGKMRFVVRESQSGKVFLRHYRLYLLGDSIVGHTKVGGGSGPFRATRVKE